MIQQYDVKKYDECERKDIAQMAKKSLAPKIKIGVTACFIGNRTKVMEWAAYHRAIGVDHIWIYANDEWDDARYLPPRPYITLIPWNFHIPPFIRIRIYREFKFQVDSMNDALSSKANGYRLDRSYWRGRIYHRLSCRKTRRWEFAADTLF